MQLDEMKRISAEMFSAESKGTTKETTPPTISTAIVDFAKSIGADLPRYVPVVLDEFGIYGFCSDGVALRVRESGGRILYGWTIWERPSVLYTAEFHAVWSAPDGTLHDITPKPGNESKIAFSPAPAYPTDFDFLKRPTNRLKRAYIAADPLETAKVKLATMSSPQKTYESKRADNAGVTLEVWLASRVPADPKVAIIDEFIALVEELHGLTVLTSRGTKISNMSRARAIVTRQRELDLFIRHY